MLRSIEIRTVQTGEMRALFLLCPLVASLSPPLRVETRQGPVVGEERRVTDPRTGVEVFWTEFRNIPYAAPPVGERRFLPPSPPPTWTQPRVSADQNLTICPQLGGLTTLYGRSDEARHYMRHRT